MAGNIGGKVMQIPYGAPNSFRAGRPENFDTPVLRYLTLDGVVTFTRLASHLKRDTLVLLVNIRIS